MVLTMGKSAYYLCGGYESADRDVKPSALLQWEAIRWARDRGCETYDFGGIPDEVGRPGPARPDDSVDSGQIDDRPSRDLWGVYHFKRGFGGRVVRYVGAYTRVYEPRRNWLWGVLASRFQAFSGLFDR